MASWPRFSDYADALLESGTLNDQGLRSLELVRDEDGRPRMRRGQSGTVFHFGTGHESYAFKVFTRNMADLRGRHMHISEHLRTLSGQTTCLVEISYLEQGVYVNEAWYPAVKMKWCEGQTLGDFLRPHVEDHSPIDNAALSRAWLDVLGQLRTARVLHGDLQEGNILVDDRGVLHLVDYDGMFVPSMAGAYKAIERGHPNYQHPLRTRGEYELGDAAIEDFSGLVVLIDLLAATPERWERFNRQDGILISPSDLAQPERSELLADLSEAPGPLGTVAKLFRDALRTLPDASRALEEAAGVLGTKLSARGEPGRSGSGDLVVPEEEEELARLIAEAIRQDMSNSDIAEHLGLPVAQVRSRILRLQQKLQVSSRASIPTALLGSRPQPSLPKEVGPLAPSPESPPTPPTLPTLTKGETALLMQLAAGRTPADAARALGVTPGTVTRNASSLQTKLGATPMTEAIAVARQQGLIPAWINQRLVQTLEAIRAQGSYAAAAPVLGVSVRTVANRARELRVALNVNSDALAIEQATKDGVLRPLSQDRGSRPKPEKPVTPTASSQPSVASATPTVRRQRTADRAKVTWQDPIRLQEPARLQKPPVSTPTPSPISTPTPSPTPARSGNSGLVLIAVLVAVLVAIIVLVVLSSQ